MTTEPLQAAQVAQMMERLNNLSSDLQELKGMLVSVISMQRDLVHVEEKVRRLFELADARGPEIARLDKRTASLERWHKAMGAAVLASLGIVSWGVQRIEYLYRMDNRIAMLELQVNNPQKVERTLQPPAAAGNK